MAKTGKAERVDETAITLSHSILGYDIYVDGDCAGAIEGVPGRIEYLLIEPYMEGKGVARAALHEFIHLSRAHGASEITTNNVVNPAMEHILKTEDFKEQPDESGWVKEIL